MAKAISFKEFQQRVEKTYPNEKFKICKYTNMSLPLEIQCLECLRVLHYPAAKNFFAKNKTCGCSNCQGISLKHKQNLEQVCQKYEIIEKRERWYTCRCKKCGRVSTHELISFTQNSCRCEAPGNHYSEEEFRQVLNENYGGEYEPIERFSGVNNKILFKHTCGFIWNTTPAHILYNKTGCPKCSQKQSKGSKKIEQILKNLNIEYICEAPLENSLQRFDFYINVNNKQYAIEYNGEQHYRYIPFLHGNDIAVFEKYKERDMKKKKYCEQHNITLITIPYDMSDSEIFATLNNLLGSKTSHNDVASSEAK